MRSSSIEKRTTFVFVVLPENLFHGEDFSRNGRVMQHKYTNENEKSRFVRPEKKENLISLIIETKGKVTNQIRVPKSNCTTHWKFSHQ